MKIINESKKQVVPVDFIASFISRAWGEVGSLKADINMVKQSFTQASKVSEVLQDLSDAYLIAIGQLEDFIGKKGVELPEKEEVKESLTEDLDNAKNVIRIDVLVEPKETIGEALPSGKLEDKYDEQTLEDWQDFASTIEGIIERNGEVVNSSYSKNTDSLSQYIDYYVIKEDGTRYNGIIDLRLSDHKQTQNGRELRKKKVSRLDPYYSLISITVNDHIFDSYNDALKYAENLINVQVDNKKKNEALLKEAVANPPEKVEKINDGNKVELHTELPDYDVEVEQKGKKVEVEFEPKDLGLNKTSLSTKATLDINNPFDAFDSDMLDYTDSTPKVSDTGYFDDTVFNAAEDVKERCKADPDDMFNVEFGEPVDDAESAEAEEAIRQWKARHSF